MREKLIIFRINLITLVKINLRGIYQDFQAIHKIVKKAQSADYKNIKINCMARSVHGDFCSDLAVTTQPPTFNNH